MDCLMHELYLNQSCLEDQFLLFIWVEKKWGGTQVTLSIVSHLPTFVLTIFETTFYSVVQDGPNFIILLSQPP